VSAEAGAGVSIGLQAGAEVGGKAEVHGNTISIGVEGELELLAGVELNAELSVDTTPVVELAEQVADDTAKLAEQAALEAARIAQAKAEYAARVAQEEAEHAAREAREASERAARETQAAAESAAREADRLAREAANRAANEMNKAFKKVKFW
jgi:hypothetical protein